MCHSKYSLLLIVIFISLLSGCAAPEKSSSSQDMVSMSISRQDINNYNEFRTQFINYAQVKYTDGLLAMMAPYNYEKEKLTSFFERKIFPFFSDFKEATLPVANIVKDQYGDPGYTLYGFIKTTNGDKKPYAIAIIEKDKKFAVKNIIVNKCFSAFHVNC